MSDHERKIALREAGRVCASDQYFLARPELDTPENRKLLEDGYDRGWQNLEAGRFANGTVIPATPFVQDSHQLQVPIPPPSANINQ